LIEWLAVQTSQTSKGRDAIDRVLADPRRTTVVAPLRQHPDVLLFRRELQDGLVRVDTANRLLRLLTQVVAGLPA